MSDKVLYWVSISLAGLGLLILVANVCLINSNRGMQNDLGQRQAAINNAGNLNQLNQALIQALAQAAVNDEDRDAKDLLSSQGITLKPKAAAASASSENADKKK
jgi:hypothetical protein